MDSAKPEGPIQHLLESQRAARIRQRLHGRDPLPGSSRRPPEPAEPAQHPKRCYQHELPPTYLQDPGQGTLDTLPLTLHDLENEDPLVPAYEDAGFNQNFLVGFVPSGDSVYHGLASQLNRRFSNGLQFQAAYTFSHNIDNSTADFFSTVLTPRRAQDFQNLKADRSNSALDRRHRFTIMAIYNLPS